MKQIKISIFSTQTFFCTDDFSWNEWLKKKVALIVIKNSWWTIWNLCAYYWSDVTDIPAPQIESAWRERKCGAIWWHDVEGSLHFLIPIHELLAESSVWVRISSDEDDKNWSSFISDVSQRWLNQSVTVPAFSHQDAFSYILLAASFRLRLLSALESTVHTCWPLNTLPF